MYKIPVNYNIDELLGSSITQICFCSNLIHVILSNNIYIEIMGSFTLKIDERSKYYEEIYPITNDFGLLNLLDKEIKKVNTNNKRETLQLEFEEQMHLICHGNEYYESFIISINGSEIIV
ncbi:MAG: hypothetical protein QG635_2323 [Bacteroidota bacterium]|nr:hypothetical protein [Bacteroidota bacterium]